MSGSHNLSFLPSSLSLVALAIAFCACSSGNSGPPEGSPEAPTDLTGKQRYSGTSSVSLNWVDNSADETSFEIYRTGNGKDWSVIGNVPADTTTYAAGAPKYDMVYIYVVKAKNDKGLSRPTNRVEVKTGKRPRKPLGPDGSCGLILSDFGIGAVNPELARSRATNSLCLFSASDKVAVDAVQEFGTAGGQVILRGQRDDAVIARIVRWVDGDTIHLEADVAWRNPPPVENWEVCFAVHDPRSSDIRALVSQHGLSRWVPQKVHVPVIGRFPIQPGRTYAVRFAIDTRRARYSVHVDGIPLATDVSLDRILVMPASVIRPFATGND